MTKIIFKCSGGMLDREIDLTLYLDDLPADETKKLLQLIKEADFYNLPTNLIKYPSPEKIEYIIGVENGNARHTVRVNEETMPPELRPLLNELSTRMDMEPE